MPEIHSNFENIIGQNRAKRLLSGGIEAAKNGRPAISPLIQGAAGLGKTEVMHRYLDALETNGFHVLRYGSPRELRLAGSAWEQFTETVCDPSKKWAVGFDECHEVHDTTKNMKTLFAFWRKALDRTNDKREITLTEEFSTFFDRSKHVIALATNFPHRLDSSNAMQSRCDKIELDLYTHDELRRILAVMMRNIEMEVENEEVLQIIANCGRGTARPMKTIVENLNTMFGTESPITKEQTLEILRLIKLYPKGLSDFEIELLLNARSTPLRDTQFLARCPSVEAAQLRLSKGYLTSHDVGLLTQLPSGMETTKKGCRYLQLMADLGFIDEARLMD